MLLSTVVQYISYYDRTDNDARSCSIRRRFGTSVKKCRHTRAYRRRGELVDVVSRVLVCPFLNHQGALWVTGCSFSDESKPEPAAVRVWALKYGA